MSIGLIYWDVFISLVGFSVFLYGKKRPDTAALVAGIILMVYPYLVSSIEWSIAIGVGICIAFILFKRFVRL